MVDLDLQCFVIIDSVVAPVIETISPTADHVGRYAVGVSIGSCERGVVRRPLRESQACRAADARTAHNRCLVGIVRRSVAFEDMAAMVGHVCHIYAGL